MNNNMINFDEYIRQGEPQQREKGYAWQTAIGLQAVDGLKPSDYLIETARKDIEGEITIDEAEQLIKSYYQSKEARTPEDDEMHEPVRFAITILPKKSGYCVVIRCCMFPHPTFAMRSNTTWNKNACSTTPKWTEMD